MSSSCIDSAEWSQRLSGRDIRLAFFDVDGTLLGLDGGYTQRLKRALSAVQGLGVKTAIASGRPKFAVDFLISELGLDAAGLYYTGALVFDPQTGESLIQQPLATDRVQLLIERARQLQVYTEVCTRDDFYIETNNPIGDVHSEHLRVTPKLKGFDNLVTAEPVFKLLMAVDEDHQPGVLQQLQQEFSDLVFAYACLPTYPSWSFVSIIDPKACKHTAFDCLLEYHQVKPDQVIAFGDADSDKVFLSRAGLGVAMGNAKPEIKAVADAVTVAAADDGVAQVLEILADVS